MPNPFSFVEKLRLDNLYPSVPNKKIKGYPLYERFLQDLDQNIGGSDPFAPHTNPIPPPSKPMDVVFNDSNISETARAMGAAKTIHDINLNKNALSPYQAGQLSLRDKEIQQRGALAQGKLGIDNKKTEIADYKARNPGHKLTQGKDGRLRSFNPLTQQITDLGETGMSEQEIAALDQGNDLQKIDRTGEMARETERLRQSGDQTLAGLRAKFEREKQDDAQAATVAAADAKRNTPILPNQARIAKLTRAETARNTNPEWAKYIKIVPGGGYVVSPPKWGGLSGPSPETFKAINDFIEATPDPIRSVETSSPIPQSEEIKISPSASGKPKSKYKVTVR